MLRRIDQRDGNRGSPQEAEWAMDLDNVEIPGFMEQYVELWREGRLFP